MENKQRLLEIIRWLDHKRWESSGQHKLINNIIFEELSSDQKILVHWLCYITDRQTPYERIWTEAGIVFSGIVKEFCQNNLHFRNLSEFVSDEKGIKFIYKEFKPFASRFVTTDLKSILLTLKILDQNSNQRNIIKYLNNIFLKYKHIIDEKKDDTRKKTIGDLKPNFTNFIAFILYLLSYKNIKRNEKDSHKNIENYFDEINYYYDLFLNEINNSEIFYKNYRIFLKYRFSDKKRIWCCVRDYLKSPEFNKYFIDAITKIDDVEKLKTAISNEDILYGLELPGDVWNLKKEFVENLIKKNLEIEGKNIPRELRAKLENPFYPELFDISFDFVPRMCSNPINKIYGVMCKNCIFGDSGMENFCHGLEKYSCPVLMIACGYSTQCQPKTCPIEKKIGLNLCSGIDLKKND